MNIAAIEKALIKTYRSRLYRPFVNALDDYKMISSGDRIAVCLSGGKDSFVMGKLFQETARRGKIKFSLKFIAIDPGYGEEHLQSLLDNARRLKIPVLVKEKNIFKTATKLAGDKPCYICARMRRGALYEFARDCGCNKIALGHHFNDAIETILMNIFFAGSFELMMPKLKSTNFPGMELIRPMIYVKEKDIANFMRYAGIETGDCGCEIAGERDSARAEIKKLISQLKKTNKDIDINIFRSGANINLDRAIKWRHRGKTFSFLDLYD